MDHLRELRSQSTNTFSNFFERLHATTTLNSVFHDSRFYSCQSLIPQCLPVPPSIMESNDNLHYENHFASQGKTALEDHCLALRQTFMQIGTLLEEKDLEIERFSREVSDWLSGGIVPCTHPDCPIVTPHNNGRYLHNNEQFRRRNQRHASRSRSEIYPSNWHRRWGTCNPPPSVWVAHRRICRRQGSQVDVDICNGFAAAHVAIMDDGDSEDGDSDGGDSEDEGTDDGDSDHGGSDHEGGEDEDSETDLIWQT